MDAAPLPPRLLAYAQANAPRYTSYPTAPHFSGDIGAEAATAWLGALPHSEALSLYVHVPYCKQLCWYCACHTVGASSSAPVSRYGQTLIREIELIADLTQARGALHLHWGGGSPNSLKPSEFANIVDALARRFDLSRLEEHAVELDPRTLDDDMIKALGAHGVTRASLGVQTFTDETQAAIGRIQPLSLVSASVERLRAVGVAGLNMDLMYGMPHQTPATVAADCARAADLGADRVAVFGYAHVPWFKSRQKLIKTEDLPGAAARMAQAEAARAMLTARGYVEIGFDHFARSEDSMARRAHDGALKRNFQGYTADCGETLIGFGASAISSYPQGYVQNAPAIPAWRAAIEADRPAGMRGIALDGEDRLRRAVIERLMCAGAVDVGELAQAYGASPDVFREDFDQLARLEEDGLVRVDHLRVEVTPVGRPFVRLAAACFDAYLARAQARHSRAV